MPTVNEQLQAAAISHAVDLQHLSSAEARKIIKLLNSVDSDLRAQLIAAIERLGAESYTARHLNTVLASVLALNKEVYASIGEALAQSVLDIGKYEVDYQEALFRQVIPEQVIVQVDLASVSASQVREIALARPFQGRLLKEWTSDLEVNRAARIRDGIRMGMVEGQTTDQIVRRVMGVKAEGYKDGLLERSRHDIDSMVRTAISHTAQGARDAFYKENNDIVGEVRWLSTLDNRTSAPCRLRDRLVYTNDANHDPVGHKVPWGAGPGRLHWCCRSTSLPIVRSYEELRLAKGLPESTRASMDGQVPQSTTYGAWLKAQSAARQDEVLGPVRGKLFRDGGLSIDSFYNDKGKYLTLEQLKERDAAAFSRAGL